MRIVLFLQKVELVIRKIMTPDFTFKLNVLYPAVPVTTEL